MYKLYKIKTLCEIKVKFYTNDYGTKHCINGVNARYMLLRDADAFDATRNERYSVASLLTAALSMTSFNRNFHNLRETSGARHGNATFI